MNICICHDEKLKTYLANRGLNYQASGLTPNKKTKYWVYNETSTYVQFVEDYKREEDK